MPVLFILSCIVKCLPCDWASGIEIRFGIHHESSFRNEFLMFDVKAPLLSHGHGRRRALERFVRAEIQQIFPLSWYSQFSMYQFATGIMTIKHFRASLSIVVLLQSTCQSGDLGSASGPIVFLPWSSG